MSEPECPANAFDPEHVGPWSTRCPRCGTEHAEGLGELVERADGSTWRLPPRPIERCVLCRLPNPTPAGYMIPQHDDPEGLL